MLKQWVSLVLVLAVCLPGCGKRTAPLPTTYPVHGKVTYKDGKPVSGGTVQFQPQAEPSVTTAATIQSDGTYRLATMRDGLRADGAVAGPNRVTVILADNENNDRERGKAPMIQPMAFPTTYPTPYTVEPCNNKFDLTVERPPVPGH